MRGLGRAGFVRASALRLNLASHRLEADVRGFLSGRVSQGLLNPGDVILDGDSANRLANEI